MPCNSWLPVISRYNVSVLWRELPVIFYRYALIYKTCPRARCDVRNSHHYSCAFRDNWWQQSCAWKLHELYLCVTFLIFYLQHMGLEKYSNWQPITWQTINANGYRNSVYGFKPVYGSFIILVLVFRGYSMHSKLFFGRASFLLIELYKSLKCCSDQLIRCNSVRKR